jgi:hypothetical protein
MRLARVSGSRGLLLKASSRLLSASWKLPIFMWHTATALYSRACAAACFKPQVRWRRYVQEEAHRPVVLLRHLLIDVHRLLHLGAPLSIAGLVSTQILRCSDHYLLTSAMFNQAVASCVTMASSSVVDMACKVLCQVTAPPR